MANIPFYNVQAWLFMPSMYPQNLWKSKNQKYLLKKSKEKKEESLGHVIPLAGSGYVRTSSALTSMSKGETL